MLVSKAIANEFFFFMITIENNHRKLRSCIALVLTINTLGISESEQKDAHIMIRTRMKTTKPQLRVLRVLRVNALDLTFLMSDVVRSLQCFKKSKDKKISLLGQFDFDLCFYCCFECLRAYLVPKKIDVHFSL